MQKTNNIGELYKNAFVAGATGYVGRELVGQLITSGIQAFAHIRPDSANLEESSTYFSSLSAHVLTTSFKKDELEKAFLENEIDAVFCVIGTTKSRMKKLKTENQDPKLASYENVDFGITKLLVDAACKLEKKPVFIYLSSLGTNSMTNNSYLKARYQAEQSVIESGLQYFIFRPAIITGIDRQENRPMELYSAKAFDGILSGLSAFGIEKFKNNYASITAEKLANAMITMPQKSSQPNRIFERKDI